MVTRRYFIAVCLAAYISTRTALGDEVCYNVCDDYEWDDDLEDYVCRSSHNECEPVSPPPPAPSPIPDPATDSPPQPVNSPYSDPSQSPGSDDLINVATGSGNPDGTLVYNASSSGYSGDSGYNYVFASETPGVGARGNHESAGPPSPREANSATDTSAASSPASAGSTFHDDNYMSRVGKVNSPYEGDRIESDVKVFPNAVKNGLQMVGWVTGHPLPEMVAEGIGIGGGLDVKATSAVGTGLEGGAHIVTGILSFQSANAFREAFLPELMLTGALEGFVVGGPIGAAVGLVVGTGAGLGGAWGVGKSVEWIGEKFIEMAGQIPEAYDAIETQLGVLERNIIRSYGDPSGGPLLP